MSIVPEQIFPAYVVWEITLRCDRYTGGVGGGHGTGTSGGGGHGGASSTSSAGG